MFRYQVFLEATKKMSQSQVPLLHEVIPLIDIITHHIDKFIDNTENFPAVRSAARQGRAMIDKYYGLTDESIVYRVAMSGSVFLSIYRKLTWSISASSSLQVVVLCQSEMAT
jgi:hypothetical protein